MLATIGDKYANGRRCSTEYTFRGAVGFREDEQTP